MDRIWLKSYPKGVDAEIDINAYASIRDVFDRVVGQFGPRPAYTCMGHSITFAELDARSAAFGAFLQGRGLKKGATGVDYCDACKDRRWRLAKQAVARD